MKDLNYILFSIKQIEDKTTELYEAMMDGVKEDVLKITREIKRLCSDIAEDQKD